MIARRRGVGYLLLLLILTGCGGEPATRMGETEGTIPAPEVVLPAATPEPSDPADRFDVVSDLWVELDGDDARVKFTVELENRTSATAAPTFVSIEEHNWIAQGGEKLDVGGGTIGIRRPLELAPGERAFMNRGDFTTLGSAEFRKGNYEGAGMSGVITLEDETSATFQLPFAYAEKFSLDEAGGPVSEPWADPPEGEVVSFRD
jgi:hypothetical protein